MIHIIDKIKTLFRKDKDLYSALYAILGFYPKDISLYKTAFTHRCNNQRFQNNRRSRRSEERKSALRETDNERLEYLGDAVLETVVSELLFRQYPKKREGFLTATRSKLVARETLGKFAKELKLERFMNLPKTGGNRKSYAAGNAFEALVGAIFLDRGYKYAYHFIKHLIKKQIVDIESTAKKEVNFKSRLLEYCQKNKIHYRFHSTSTQVDKQDAPEFTSDVFIEELLAGQGKGFSKKESEQNAAKSALVKMRYEGQFVSEILRAKESRTAMEAPEFSALPRIREIDEEVRHLNKLAREEKETKTEESKPERRSRKAERPVKARERRVAQQVKAEQEKAEQNVEVLQATEPEVTLEEASTSKGVTAAIEEKVQTIGEQKTAGKQPQKSSLINTSLPVSSSVDPSVKPAVLALVEALRASTPAAVPSLSTTTPSSQSKTSRQAAVASLVTKLAAQKMQTTSGVNKMKDIKHQSTVKGENRRRKKTKPEPTAEELASELEALKAAALREIQASNGKMYE